MTTSKPDRRVERTRNLLRTALMELIQEKDYDRITVQDIIDRANVGRSTFYAHFVDKDDLLAGNMFDFQIEIGQHFASSADAGMLLRTTESFKRVQENYALYRAMVGTDGIVLVQRMARDNLRKNLEQRIALLAEGGHPVPLPPQILVHYLTGAFFGLLEWWLDNNMPYSPEEMDDMFQKMTMVGLERLVTETG